MKRFSLLLLFSLVVTLGVQFFSSEESEQVVEPVVEKTVKKIVTPTVTPSPRPTPIKVVKPKVVPIAPRREIPTPRATPVVNKPPKVRGITRKDEQSYFIDADGNILVTNIMLQGNDAIFQGDILLGDWEKLKENVDANGNIRPVKLPKGKTWEKGIVPFEIKPGLSNRDEILKAVKYINEKTNITFKERTTEEDYIFFTEGEQNCLSYVGKQGGAQDIKLAKGCLRNEVLHEMYHAIGFIHEHSREDRDDYIDIIWPNIEYEYHPQFYKLPLDYMQVTDTPFDFNSIMLYPPNAFAIDKNDYSMLKVNGEPYQKDPEVILSPWDIKRVNRVYPSDK